MKGNFLAVDKNKYLGKGLKSIEILILAHIEEFQRNGEECYMTNEQFSHKFGESLATIKRAIAKLEEQNIIRRDTTFIEGNGRGNRQRKLYVNPVSEWKGQFDLTITMEGSKNTMEGSNVDNGRLKNEQWKDHNEPIKDNLKENIKDNLKESKSSFRTFKDLSLEEIDEIINKLKNGKPYIEIQKSYNLEFGSVNKNTIKELEEIRKERVYWINYNAEQLQKSNEPEIDYNRLFGNTKKKTQEEIDHDKMMEEMMNELFIEM